MSTNISKDELRLLAYLHQQAKGFGELFKIAMGDVAKALEVPDEQLQKDASFLMEHGLVGLKILDVSSDGLEEYWFQAVYLTGHGENFMRELEQQMSAELEKAPDEGTGKAKKITVKAAGFLYDTGRAVIVKILADFLGGHH